MTNAGNVPLSNIHVSDNRGVVPVYVSGDANNDGILDLSETWVYEASGTAGAGDYANIGTSTGDYTDDHGNSETANDSDDSSYFGGNPAIDIVKTTNGTDGSEILEGTTVTWTYTVTNAGNVPLGNIQVSDNQGVIPLFVSGDANNDDILDLTETWVYEATGTAGTGDYANVGTSTRD
ncbi:MAG: hypothetical protein OEQ39_02700 [Gammaproteobacteria bacterium]|nr:hypothetical protein [Gammaproteobacteria bacterium]MDH3464937.1 hypothetical protein [Gammaproteobacteria bacterium]